MASKKRGRSDFDFDDDLNFDIPDFGGDDPAATANDRKPIATGLKSAAVGFGKTFTNEARLRKTLTKSLPREYEEPISKAFEIKDGVRDLYNSTSSQTQEIIRESKRSIGRIARNLEPALPKKFAERLKKMGDSAESSGYGSTSKEEVEQNTINNAFAEIFAKTQEVQAEKENKQNARQILQERIDQKRHHDTTQILGSIDQSLITLSTFQQKEGVNYMKKSLELQFRSYFVQNDMLQLQSKFFEQFKNDLAAITKNTGLPDYVKKAPKEALLEHIRERTFESLSGSLAKRRSQWLQGVFKKAGDKASDTLGQVRDNLSMVFDTAESASSMYGSGMGPSGAEIAGDVAGGWAGGKAQDAMAKRVRAWAKKNPNIAKFGNKLGMGVNAMPQWINEQVQNGKYSHKVPDWLRDILSVDEESSSLRMNKEVDLERATQFSDKNSRSLNVVIPELLSRIHQELYIGRTGDTKAGPLTYDYEKGKFVTSKERQQSLLGSIVSKRSVEETQQRMKDIFSEIDPEGKLDQATRDKIAESIYGANKRSMYFDKESMRSYNVLGDNHDKAGDLVRAYIDKDPSGANERRLSGLFGRVGANNGEVKDYVQALIDSGRHGELAQLGLINLETGQINLEMVRRMELGQDIAKDLSAAAATASSTQSIESPAASGGGGFKKSAMARKQGGFINLGGPKMAAGGYEAPSFEQLSKLFKESIESLKGVRESGKASGDCCDKIAEAIQEASGKTELQEIRDILKRIEETGLGGGGAMMTPEMLEAYMRDKATGYFGKAGKAMKGFGKSLWGGAVASYKRTTNIGKSILGFGKKTGTGAMGWLSKQKDRFDLFVDGEVEPRLSKAKLEAGKYMDVATGKIITKFEDIKGDIRDIDKNEIVLYASEIKDSVLKNLESGKTKLASMTDWGKSAIGALYKGARRSASQLFGMGRSVYGMAWQALGAAYERLTDGPQDVYLKDQYDTPVLLKRVMSKGLYFDKETLDSISKVSDIKGPVVDNENNVLITKEDLHNGLYDKKGQEIKTGFDRIGQFVGNSVKNAIGAYKKILGKAKDAGTKAMAWIKGLFGFDSPFTVFSKQTNDILSAIYNLLNDRMPGERSPELDAAIASGNSRGGDVAGAVSGGAAKAWTAAKGKATDAFNKLRGVDVEALKGHRQKVLDKMGRVTDPAVDKLGELVELFKERMPEPAKKVFGDTNGDGVRDGSIDDIRSKRDALREKLGEKAAEVKEKMGAGSKSAFGAVADAIKKLSEKEEEEGGKDGDTYVDLGDGEGKDEKGKKGKKKKPRGKMGRAWDKLKNKMTPKGKGLGARAVRGFGRMVGGAAKGLGRLGLWGGRALLGGGLMSTGLLSGGLSAVGSLLGMGASALGAVIASPITVPALAVAGIGVAGYFAYKWLTNPDPKPIEKVRLTQYGWKADNVEAYKKMKSLEEMLKTAVSFKGDTAEINKEKVDVGKMMEIYGLDRSNQDHARKFVDWFVNRFRPIFLHHQALIKTTNSPKPLEDVDSNKPELKKQYLDQCLFPGGHYGITTSPFKDQESLSTNQYSVEQQIAEAKRLVEKEGSATENKKFVSNAGGAAIGMVKVKQAVEKKELEAEEKKQKEATVGVPQAKQAPRDPDKVAASLRLQAATIGANQAPGGPGRDPSDPINSPAPANMGGTVKSRPVPKPTSKQGEQVKSILLRDMPKFGITTPNQQAALLGNIEHESNFMPVSENLNYRAETMVRLWPNRFKTIADAQAVASKGPQGIANSIYGNRMGNTDPNDGWDYRGRGPIQITGKSNYARIGKMIGKDIVENPDKVITDPQTAADTAMAYWKMNPKLGENADAGNFAAVRKAINGGSIGMDDAMSRVSKYLDLIKNNQLPLGASVSSQGKTLEDTGDEAARLRAASEPTLVSSPKPSKPNVAVGLENNPNTGPVPTSFQASKSMGQGELVSSPRPSSSPSSGSAPVATTTPAIRDTYYQKQSSVNTGDSLDIMRQSLKENQEHTNLLRRIAEGIENLPKNLAEVVSGTQPAAAPAAPSESNNYNKPSAPMKAPSMGFRRNLAGV